jgi:hypothetical protein
MPATRPAPRTFADIAVGDVLDLYGHEGVVTDVKVTKTGRITIRGAGFVQTARPTTPAIWKD